MQGTRTYFHYSDEGLIGEYDSIGTEIKTYGYKPGSIWTTDPLFLKENGQYYFYHNDHLGTPQKITAVNGAVVWSAKYSSFGKATVEIETVENNLRFPGQYFDSETGLHYNFLRYYEPKVGRYLRADPIGIAGGINLFVYVENNTVNRLYPYGEVGLPWQLDLIDTLRNAYETLQEFDQIRQARLNAIQLLKDIEGDRIQIKENLKYCEEEKCLKYYLCDLESCMSDCLQTYLDDMERFVWNPGDRIRQKYKDDPSVSPYF